MCRRRRRAVNCKTSLLAMYKNIWLISSFTETLRTITVCRVVWILRQWSSPCLEFLHVQHKVFFHSSRWKIFLFFHSFYLQITLTRHNFWFTVPFHMVCESTNLETLIRRTFVFTIKTWIEMQMKNRLEKNIN